MLCYFQLYSKVIQLYIHIYINLFFFRFFSIIGYYKILSIGDFPGGPVVKTPHFHYRGHRFNPWSGN